jgi:hypothetical protein
LLQRLEHLLSLLYCNIGLRVINCDEGSICPYLIAGFQHDIVELICILECDCSPDAEATYDVFPEKLLDCCEAYVGDRLHLDPLDEILNCYDGESVAALSWGQWAYYVYSPSLERS